MAHFKNICLGFLCFVIYNTGYSQEGTLRALRVGDKLPSAINLKVFKGKVVNENIRSKYQGKYLILDFWATWCTSCIASFPKLEKWQEKYKNKLQVILVNPENYHDTEEKVSEFYNKWKTTKGKSLSLPTVLTDTYLDKLFPRRAVPHYAWIDPDGTVKAITQNIEVTEENIEAFLNGRLPEMPEKVDIDFDKPLFSSDFFPESKMLTYSVLFKGYINWMKGNVNRFSGDTLRGVMYANYYLLDLYSLTAVKLIPSYTTKRLVVENVDSSELFKEKATIDPVSWRKRNSYTLDIILPPEQSAKLSEEILRLLNSSTEYEGVVEKRKVPCLILRRIGVIDRIATKNSEPSRLLVNGKLEFTATTFSSFARFLEQREDTREYVIDETNYKGKVDLRISASSNITEWRTDMQKVGLDLVPEERMIEVLVLRSKRLNPVSNKLALKTDNKSDASNN